MRKFRHEILDPANAVTICLEWLDQENIRLMFPDQFARLGEAMRAAADLISFVASDDCDHSLLADTRVPNHYSPEGSLPARTGAPFFRGDASSNKSIWAGGNGTFACFAKVLVGQGLTNRSHRFLYGNRGRKFRKI